MSSKRRQRVALLLIALLAILPLRTLFAGWNAATGEHPCSHADATAATHAHHGEQAHRCCTTTAADHIGDDHADGCQGGCDQCTACAATFLGSASDTHLVDLDHCALLTAPSGVPLHLITSLLRPPRPFS